MPHFVFGQFSRPLQAVLASLKHSRFKKSGLNCRRRALIVPPHPIFCAVKYIEINYFWEKQKESDWIRICLELSGAGKVFHLPKVSIYCFPIKKNCEECWRSRRLNKQDTNYRPEFLQGHRFRGKNLQRKIKLHAGEPLRH